MGRRYLDNHLSRPLRNPGAALTIVGAAALLISLVNSWYASRAERRAVWVPAGVTTARIQLDDAKALLADVAGSAALVVLVGLALIVPFRGPANAASPIVPLPIGVAVLIFGTATAGTLPSLFTWPRASQMANQPAGYPAHLATGQWFRPTTATSSTI